MKYLLFSLFLVPLTTTAQTKSDYEQAMAKFQRFYNAGQGDSINTMFKYDASFLWKNGKADSYVKKFGTLKSYKFIGIDRTDPNKVWVFKTVFSKAGTKTTSLTLNKNNQLENFRFMTESEGITELLRKDKSKK